MTTYVETQQEILAVRPRSDRHRELVARSDALLECIEGMNLRRYGAVRANDSRDFHAVRLTHGLAKAISDLAVGVGLAACWPTSTREALDCVYDIQDALFGHPPDDEPHQEELFPCDS